MYRAFYDLVERPFDLTCHLKYFLMTPGHEEAACNLEYGITAGSGITLLLGEAGTGKTSVLQVVLASIAETSGTAPRFVYVSNPTLTPSEFIDTLAHEFKLSTEAARSKSQLVRELENMLVQRRANGHVTALIIDEAQSLPDDLLEEVRLLANMEWANEKLLRIVLTGQPALGERLNQPGLRQLKQRISLRCTLPALDLNDTATYIAHRISLAGGTPGRIFSRDAVSTIYEQSLGIPRTINVLCENAMLTAFATGRRSVTAEIVREVCADFDIGERPAGPIGSSAQPQMPAVDGSHPATEGRPPCAALPSRGR